MKQVDILLIEDSISIAQTYIEYLRPTGFAVHHCSRGDEALCFLADNTPDLILLDLMLPDMNGMDILDYVTEKELPLNVVVVTAHGSVEIAVEAMQKQAFDFLLKPFNARRLVTTVQNALDNRKLKEIVSTLEEALPKQGLGNFIGSSYAMQAVYQMIKNAAASDAPVFITGESGTGKEVCAQSLHQQSKRKSKPFVALNCGAIPRELLESEIFGHKKGAFTGAISDRMGTAQMADGGTLFLDEICELDVDLQIKLLRFIQTKTFRKVGGDQEISVDIRFICATNKIPLKLVREGSFREDLYYRLNVIPIHMPPLRERNGDVVELAEHFLRKYNMAEGKSFKKIDAEVLALFAEYNWLGNVRELQNVIQQIVVLHNDDVARLDMIPAHLLSPPRPQNALQEQINFHRPAGAEIKSSPLSENGTRPLWAVEKEAIESTIENCDGNVVKAAACLEVSPSTIYRKMRNWGVDL